MKLEETKKDKLRKAFAEYFKDCEGDWNIDASDLAEDMLEITIKVLENEA